MTQAKNCEKRTFALKTGANPLEMRDTNGKSTEVLVGKAAVFDEFTEIRDCWGEKFFERFSPDCMKNTLANGHKVMILHNHSWDALLGSTADVLVLTAKSDGLYFEFTPKNFEFDRRIADFVRSGTIDGVSIGWRTIDQEWEQRDGEWFRTILEIELYEISLTPIPAYGQTTVEIELRKLISEETESTPAETTEERTRILEEANNFLKKLEESK